MMRLLHSIPSTPLDFRANSRQLIRLSARALQWSVAIVAISLSAQCANAQVRIEPYDPSGLDSLLDDRSNTNSIGVIVSEAKPAADETPTNSTDSSEATDRAQLSSSEPASSNSSELWELNEIADDSCLSNSMRRDEIWVVSSRNISCPGCDDSRLTYQQQIESRWERRTSDDFDHSLTHSPKPTVVFVHGNRTDSSYALRRGMQAYRSFVSQAPTEQEIRFVIWSWPSERVLFGLRDFRAKADRADLEGCLFGTFLSRLPGTQPVNLIGYSYGSRIVLGGVSMLSGQALWGRRVSLPEDYAPPPMRVTLIAAAAPPSSLLPGQRYYPAYELIDRLVLINNREDRILKAYRLVDRAAASVALGSLGMATQRLEDAGNRIAQWDVSRSIGPQHKIDLYFGSAVVGRLVREQVAWFANDKSSPQASDSRSSSGRR